MKLRTLEKILVNSPMRVHYHRKTSAPRVLGGLDLAGGTCLEIGGGSGAGALLIRKYTGCRRLVCVDIDPGMIAAARKCISRPPRWARGIPTDNIEFILEDAVDFSFADGSFDAAFHFAVFDHIKEWRQVIVEVYRVLWPGGTYSFEDILLPDAWFYFHGYFGHVVIKENDLKEALTSAGFTILSFNKIRQTCVVRAKKA